MSVVSYILGHLSVNRIQTLAPQARSQQQTEILIHLLKKLAPVNDISGVWYLVDPKWIFSLRIWREPQF